MVATRWFGVATLLSGWISIFVTNPATDFIVAVFLAAGGQLYIAILVAMLDGTFLAADQGGKTDV